MNLAGGTILVIRLSEDRVFLLMKNKTKVWSLVSPAAFVIAAFFTPVICCLAAGNIQQGHTAAVDASEKTIDFDDGKIVAIEDVRRGQRVTVKGEVLRLRDEDEFVLADRTGEIVVCIGWRNDMPVKSGDTVKVVAMADDDVATGMRPELYARQIAFPNGKIINLQRD